MLKMKKSIADIMSCPYCRSDNTYIYNTDEVDFDYNNIGHYYFDCHCDNCIRNFRKHIEFKYEITKDY